MTITLQSSNKVFGGEVRKYTHASASTGTDMTFSVYVPPAAALHAVPVVYYLSGLTCTDDNAVQKGGAFRACADQGIMMVFPDTSPRGADVPGEDDAYDLGTGAGFYVDATAEPWSANYKMYRYVTEELPRLSRPTSPPPPSSPSPDTPWAAMAPSPSPSRTRTPTPPSPRLPPSAIPPRCPGARRRSGRTSARRTRVRRMTRASSSVLAGRRSSSSTTSWSIRAWTISS